MSEQRTVQMSLVNPGDVADDGDVVFEMQPRYNPARSVRYALTRAEASRLATRLAEVLKK